MKGRKPRIIPLDRTPDGEPIEGLPDEPPSELDERARGEWLRIIPLLEGVATARDIALLICRCKLWSEWKTAQDHIDQHGQLVVSPNGYEMPNPSLSIARQAVDRIHKIDMEFGLTPLGRTRLKQPKPKPVENKKAKFFA